MIKTPFSVSLLIVLLLPLSGISGQKGKSPIQVLLISGKNNHEWQKTSPAFRQILEETGFFKVDITEKPDTLNASALKNYQVIASNWNAFPESTRQWGEVAEEAILDFDIKAIFNALVKADFNGYSTLEIAGEEAVLKSFDYLKKLGAV